jgi:hypothetical protein
MVPTESIDEVDQCLLALQSELSNVGIVLEERLEYWAGFTPKRKKWCQLNRSVYGRIRYYIKGRQGNPAYRKLIACFEKPPKSGLWKHLRAYRYEEAKWTIEGEDVHGVSYESLANYLGTHGCQRLLQQLQEDLTDSFGYAKQRYG